MLEGLLSGGSQGLLQPLARFGHLVHEAASLRVLFVLYLLERERLFADRLVQAVDTDGAAAQASRLRATISGLERTITAAKSLWSVA